MSCVCIKNVSHSVGQKFYPVSLQIDWPQTADVCRYGYSTVDESEKKPQLSILILFSLTMCSQLLSRLRVPWFRTWTGQCRIGVFRSVSKHVMFRFALYVIEATSNEACFSDNRKLAFRLQEFCCFNKHQLVVTKPSLFTHCRQLVHSNPRFERNL